MLIIQYLVILFAAFLIARTIVNFQRRKISLKQAILWIILWIVLLVVAILPGIMGIPATLLGIQRNVDVFVYVGIIVLFYLCFYLYNKLEDQREKITKLSRSLAIQRAETEALASKTKTTKRKTKKKSKKKKTKKKSKKKKRKKKKK